MPQRLVLALFLGLLPPSAVPSAVMAQTQSCEDRHGCPEGTVWDDQAGKCLAVSS
ncbi:hypothetical protein GCM10011452_03250 [Gemmobacter lanyuensis]|uniref:Uncharacterized protein n=1 Tax=Gemmobacter lanyuensis TaxID=1054497 RepID=A0A918ILC2_9RHOB|nr:hypothetical protein [Gemmobacter lanyuensis]GGW21661.1 hypothetical protein GCM10011452_03250 [Gemmobacter lanyuensis]